MPQEGTSKACAQARLAGCMNGTDVCPALTFGPAAEVR
jgi:hypothetical protein